MCDQTWEGSSQTDKLSTVCQRAEAHLDPVKQGKLQESVAQYHGGKPKAKETLKDTLLSRRLNKSMTSFSTKTKENKQ